MNPLLIYREIQALDDMAIRARHYGCKCITPVVEMELDINSLGTYSHSIMKTRCIFCKIEVDITVSF